MGKLAVYLRLLGFDTLYRNDYEDAQLAQISSQKQRILLTRDRGLLKRSIVDHGYIVRSDSPEEEIVEIVGRYDLREVIDPFRLCSLCNGLLMQVSKDQIQDKVPRQAYLHHNEFLQCQHCSQIYWRGSHSQQIEALLRRVKGYL